MAGLMNKKVQASSLLEVLVSMVIIMIVFTLAIGVYSKVTNSGISINDKQIQQQMQSIISASGENKEWDNESFEINNINFSKTVSNYNNYTDLYLIEVEAKKNGKVVGELRQIVKKGRKDD
jgi:type II secretory pathway pseudopilin PulG